MNVMADPGSAVVGAIAASVVKGFIEGAKLAWKYRKGAPVDDDDTRSGPELALRLAGTLLFETRANIERIRLITEYAQNNGTTYGVFDLSVTDAVLAELCRVAPSPLVIERLRHVVAMVRRVDHYQRLGHSNLDSYAKAIAFADDAIKKGVIDRFNELVDFGNAATAAAFDVPDVAALGFFPDKIDPTAKVDHAIL